MIRLPAYRNFTYFPVCRQFCNEYPERLGGCKMREFVITVNSTVDLPKEWLKERNVPVLPLKYTIDGQTYQDMEGLSAKEIFSEIKRRAYVGNFSDQS